MDNFEENIINESGFDSILELVYLVVDGEASKSEKSLVFKHIAENENLQNEFINAIKLNKITELDPNQNIAPKHLENNIFSTLGLDIKKIDRPKTTDSSLYVKSKYSKNLTNSKLFQLPLVLLFMISSWFLGYNFDKVYNIFNNSPSIIKKSDLITNEKIPITLKGSINNFNDQNNQPRNKSEEISLIKDNLDISNSSSIFKKSNFNKKDYSNNVKMILNNEITENKIISENQKIDQKDIFLISEAKIYSSFNFIQTENKSIQNEYEKSSSKLNFKTNIKKSIIEVNSIHDNNLNLFDILYQSYSIINESVLQPKDNLNNNIVRNNNEDFIVYYNQKNDHIFNKRAEAYSKSDMYYSYEIGLMYKVEKDLYLGLQYSKEYLPIYFYKNNEYTQLDFQNTFSTLVRYNLQLDESPIVKILVPFLQVNIGGSQSGLMTAMGLGADIKLVDHVSLNFSLLGTNLTYFNENGVFNLNKISTNIGINFTF